MAGERHESLYERGSTTVSDKSTNKISSKYNQSGSVSMYEKVVPSDIVERDSFSPALSSELRKSGTSATSKEGSTRSNQISQGVPITVQEGPDRMKQSHCALCGALCW